MSDCINYTELHFVSEKALKKYLDEQDTVWTKQVMAKLESSGLLRKTITQIYSDPEVSKLGILWEYDSPAAFHRCQMIIKADVLPHAHRFQMKTRSFRGVPVEEWLSNRYKTMSKVYHKGQKSDSQARKAAFDEPQTNGDDGSGNRLNGYLITGSKERWV